MKEPNIPETIKRLQEYSQNLKDNNQIGNSKIVLAFAEMITVMAWASEQQEKSSKILVTLTWWIVVLTIAMLIGLVVQIVLALV